MRPIYSKIDRAMECVKEVKLKRGWACFVEGVYVPQGALVLTSHAAKHDKDVGENVLENSVVVTDGKWKAYAFVIPESRLTAILYVDNPAEEAVKVVEYLRKTNRWRLLDGGAVALLYSEAGRLGELFRRR